MGCRVEIAVIVVVLGSFASCQGAVDRPSWETEVERIPQQVPPTAHDSAIRGNEVINPINSREVEEKNGDRSKEKIDDNIGVTALDPATTATGRKQNLQIFLKSGDKNDAVSSDGRSITSHESNSAFVDQSDPHAKNGHPASFSKKSLGGNLEGFEPDYFSQAYNWVFGNSESQMPSSDDWRFDKKVEKEGKTRPESENNIEIKRKSMLEESALMTEPRAPSNVKWNQLEGSQLKNGPSLSKEPESDLSKKRNDLRLDNPISVSTDLSNTAIEHTSLKAEEQKSLLDEGERLNFSRVINAGSEPQSGAASNYPSIQGGVDGLVTEGGALRTAEAALQSGAVISGSDSVSMDKKLSLNDSTSTEESLEWMSYGVLSDMPVPAVDER